MKTENKITEQPSRYDHLEQMSVAELLQHINEEDMLVAEAVRKAMPQIPIEFYDERFTSVLAHRAMIDGGLKKKARQDKALVDEISATIILEDYMNSRKR